MWRHLAAETISTTGGSGVVYTPTLPSSLGPVQFGKIELNTPSSGETVYYTFDGTAPSSTNGKRLIGLQNGTATPWRFGRELKMSELANMKLSGSSSDIDVRIDYYG